MAYTLPRVQIAQEFTQAATFSQKPLAAFIIGPNYKLFRYDVASEKALAAVVNPTDAAKANEYMTDKVGASETNHSASDVTYTYPNVPANSVVDQDYVKVFFDNVEAKYFPIDDLDYSLNVTVKACATSNVALNQDTVDGVNLNTGEHALLTGQTDPVENGIYTSVNNALTRHSSYAATTSTITFNLLITVGTGGSANASTKWVLYGDKIPKLGTDAVAFIKYDHATKIDSTKYPNRIKTGGCLKTQGSFSRSTVFSNRDVKVGDVIIIDDSVNKVKTKVKALYYEKLAATFGTDTFTSADGSAGNITDTDLVPDTTTLADFTGTQDITYILKVTRAGAYFNVNNAADCAQITITSTGTDSNAAPITITHNTPFSVGTLGIKAKFNGNIADTFEINDVYTIPVVAAKNGAVNIIETQDKIFEGTVASPVSGKIATDASAITYTLALTKSSIQIAELRDIADAETTLNWSTTASNIEIKKDITITDSTLIETGTTLADLPVTKAKVYVQYRALLKATASSIASISDITTVETKLGVRHPDNPLSEGVYAALLNSANVTVYYVGLNSNDLTGYNTALGLAKKTDKVYSLVPLTFDTGIQDAVVSHINSMSTKETAKWRKAWLSRPLVPTKLIYAQKPDTNDWTATVGDDPLEADTQYTLVTIAGATLITDAVRAGDTLLINFSTNAAHDVVYSEYTIEEVRSETTLVLETGLAAAITTPVKVEIRRNYSTDEQITNLADTGSDYDNRRINMVFPDTVKSGTVTKNGYFVAAALAGLRSGVVPHQPLTNIEVLGFDDYSKSVSEFTQDQLDTLADVGFWIVTQDEVGEATGYTRHQLTTDRTNLNMQEDSVTTNVDSISYGLQSALAPFIGKYNINPNNLLVIRKVIQDQLNFRKTDTYTATAGNQLVDFKINKLEQNATFKDRIDVEVSLTLPYPNNVTSITLII